MSIWLSLIANPVFHNQYGLRICRRHTSVFHWQPIFGYRRLHWHWAFACDAPFRFLSAYRQRNQALPFGCINVIDTT